MIWFHIKLGPRLLLNIQGGIFPSLDLMVVWALNHRQCDLRRCCLPSLDSSQQSGFFCRLNGQTSSIQPSPQSLSSQNDSLPFLLGAISAVTIHSSSATHLEDTSALVQPTTSKTFLRTNSLPISRRDTSNIPWSSIWARPVARSE